MQTVALSFKSHLYFHFIYNARIVIFALLLISVFVPQESTAQVIMNAYAKVTGITSGNTVLAVSNVNEANHTFTIGEQVLVIQMQDDVIGSNTSNSNTFGNLSAIANAGNYEVRTITAKSPSTGTPTSITLNGALTYTFNTGANSSVQVVTFRNLGTNFTTTSNITGLAWDGNVGGIVAIQVANNLTLNHSIAANAIGFRGGARSVDYSGPVCTNGNQNVYISNSSNYAAKGEGIYRNTNANYSYARGRLLNGGGGGADHNGGGGGGGNYTQGGQGGNGYNNCTAYPAGGLGGTALTSQISSSRLFMGGGGGGGQQNNTLGSAGGNGGGIIFIKANRLLTNTTCLNPISITANGATAANVGNDGAGGGGAGGSILFQVNTYSVNSICPLTITANGGSGGNVGDAGAHAGGGGGGQGAVIFSTPVPTGNITVNSINGQPGRDNSSGSVTAVAGSGTNNSGVITATSTPLPIELLYFKGFCNESSGVILSWATATEQNNSYFIIERSSISGIWEPIKRIDGAGNSNSQLEYTYTDHNGYGIQYYRLRQVDYNGQTEVFSPIVTNCAIADDEITLYPNPATTTFTIQTMAGIEEVVIYDNTGRLCRRISNTESGLQQTIDIADFQPACYTVHVISGGESHYFKLIKTN